MNQVSQRGHSVSDLLCTYFTSHEHLSSSIHVAVQGFIFSQSCVVFHCVSRPRIFCSLSSWLLLFAFPRWTPSVQSFVLSLEPDKKTTTEYCPLGPYRLEQVFSSSREMSFSPLKRDFVQKTVDKTQSPRPLVFILQFNDCSEQFQDLSDTCGFFFRKDRFTKYTWNRLYQTYFSKAVSFLL